MAHVAIIINACPAIFSGQRPLETVAQLECLVGYLKTIHPHNGPIREARGGAGGSAALADAIVQAGQLNRQDVKAVHSMLKPGTAIASRMSPDQQTQLGIILNNAVYEDTPTALVAKNELAQFYNANCEGSFSDFLKIGTCVMGSDRPSVLKVLAGAAGVKPAGGLGLIEVQQMLRVVELAETALGMGVYTDATRFPTSIVAAANKSYTAVDWDWVARNALPLQVLAAARIFHASCGSPSRTPFNFGNLDPQVMQEVAAQAIFWSRGFEAAVASRISVMGAELEARVDEILGKRMREMERAEGEASKGRKGEGGKGKGKGKGNGGGWGVSGAPTAPPEYCKAYQNGNCADASCPRKHEKVDEHDICRQFSRPGGCSYGSSCRFKHLA